MQQVVKKASDDLSEKRVVAADHDMWAATNVGPPTTKNVGEAMFLEPDAIVKVPSLRWWKEDGLLRRETRESRPIVFDDKTQHVGDQVRENDDNDKTTTTTETQ